MTIRQETLQEIKNFLAKEDKQKKDYRFFSGNVKKLNETSLFVDLSLDELNICQQIQIFLKEWRENYSKYPKIFSKDEELKQLKEKFEKWFEKAQKQTNKPKSVIQHHNSNWTNWETKQKQAEQALSWLEWYNEHEKALKFGFLVFLLLFAWLIIEKVIEKIR